MEFKLFGKKLYLSPVIDLFNGEIITYKIGQQPTYSLVSEMLEKALEKLSMEHQLIIHSDQGWHYQHNSWVKTLKQNKIFQSMSRKATCADNAAMENFFGLLKQEMYYGEELISYEALKKKLEKYIDYYNNDRIKQKLAGRSPVKYRTHANQLAA